MHLEAYESLVPSQNRKQPKYMSFFRAVIGQPVDGMTLLEAFDRAFSLEDAVGVQLDAVGALVQADRVLPFSPAASSRVLSDEDYRLLIRARIAQNVWNGTVESITSMFSVIFPEFGISLEDRQNMTINVVLRGMFTELQIEMINAGLLITRPAGVKMTYEIPETITSTSIMIQAGVYQDGKIEVHRRG